MNGIKTLWPWVGLLAAVLNAQAEGPSIEHAPSQPWKPRTSAVYDTGPACQSHVVRGAFASIQVNVDAKGCNIVGDAANEPSIVVDPTNPRRMAIGWRQFNSVASDFREAGWAYSHDGGHTWVFPGSVFPGVFGSDPVLQPDSEGEFYYLSIDNIEMRIFKSHDQGVSWTGPRKIYDDLYDKPWMTVDRSSCSGRNTIYICAPSRPLLRSTDQGNSFSQLPLHALGTTLTTTRSGDLILVGGDAVLEFTKIDDLSCPENGEAILHEEQLHVGRRDPLSRIPNGFGQLGQAWVVVQSNAVPEVYLSSLASVDPSDSTMDPSDVIFVRSNDGGISWSRPLVINDDPLGTNSWQWFNTMSIAPNGRIDVVWNDTRSSQQANLSELFYSSSLDGGRSWSPNVPVSPMFDSWVGWPGGNAKLGDYYTMVSDNLGVNVAYAATFNGEQDVYFLRIGPWDCNGNEIDDAADIASATSKDCNGNDVPDECEYRVDVNGDSLTTLDDYTLLAAALSGPSAPLLDKEGAGGGPPVAGALGSDCGELFDANHDDHIDLADYAYLQRVFVAP